MGRKHPQRGWRRAVCQVAVCEWRWPGATVAFLQWLARRDGGPPTPPLHFEILQHSILRRVRYTDTTVNIRRALVGTWIGKFRSWQRRRTGRHYVSLPLPTRSLDQSYLCFLVVARAGI